MTKRRIIQLCAAVIVIAILVILFIAKRERVESLTSQPEVVLDASAMEPAVMETADSEVITAEVVANEDLSESAGEVVEESVAEEPSDEILPLFVSEIDEDELRSSGLPVMIQFYSTTCVPCMSMMEDLRNFYSENYGKVRVVALDVGQYPGEASRYPVTVVPTQLFFTASGENYEPSARIRASVGNFATYTYTATGEVAYVVHQGVLNQSQMKRITNEAASL